MEYLILMLLLPFARARAQLHLKHAETYPYVPVVVETSRINDNYRRGNNILPPLRHRATVRIREKLGYANLGNQHFS